MYADSHLLMQLLAVLPEQIKQKPKFQREHIFHNILTHCSESEALEGKLDMIFHHSLYGACLARMRKHQHVGKQHFLDRIKNAPLRIKSENAKNGMDALFFPLLGYKEYAEGNFAGAKKYQDKAIRALNALVESGMRDALVGVVEQQLNAFRVLCAEKRYEEALAHAVDLVSFVNSGNQNATFAGVDLHTAWTPIDQYDFRIYYTDGIVIKFMSIVEPDLLKPFLATMASSGITWLSKDMQYGFQVMARLYGADTPLMPMPENFVFTDLPDSFQMAMLRRLPRDAGSDSSAINEKIQRYCVSLHGYKVLLKSPRLAA